MLEPARIADAIKEVFGFLREWNNADQRQKRYALRRLRNIKKATDIAEQIFFVVDDMISIVHKSVSLKESDERKLTRLEVKYRKLAQKFNNLD